MTRPFRPIIAAFVATRLTHSVRPDTDSAGAVPSLPSAPARHCFEIADAEFERDLAQRYRNVEGEI
jgi:hypothetical protein